MRDERLPVGEERIARIADDIGTPFYLYDAEAVRERFREVADAFGSSYGNADVNFAVKANTVPGLVERLVDAGAGLDCASKAEMKLAEALDVSPDKVWFTAPFQSKEALQYAVDQGYWVNCGSAQTLERMDETPSSLSFRYDPGIGAGDFGLSLGNTKFGMQEDELVDAYRRADELGVERFGIHMMTGSNVVDPGYYAKAAEAMAGMIRKLEERTGIRPSVVNIGGGFGIGYRPEDDHLDVEAASAHVASVFEDELSYEPRLLVEPGRYMVAEAGMLVASVQEVRHKQRRYLGVDTGMMHLIRPMLYDAYHHIQPLDGTGDMTTYDVVGLACENTDALARERSLPAVDAGDLLVVRDVGAYGAAMASNWNSHPRPAEILVDGDDTCCIREREDWQDVFHGTWLDE